MLFNQFVNVCIMIGGILEFLGIVGGISFLPYMAVKLYQNRPLMEEKERRCGNCSNYAACKEVGGVIEEEDLIWEACAYWEKKKP